MSTEPEPKPDLSLFLEELWDGLFHLWIALNPEDTAFQPTPEWIRDNFVIAHRIKGTSLLYEFPHIAELAGELERLLEPMTEQPPETWVPTIPRLRDLVSQLITKFEELLQGHKGRQLQVETGPAEAGGNQTAGSVEPHPAGGETREVSLPDAPSSASFLSRAWDTMKSIYPGPQPETPLPASLAPSERPPDSRLEPGEPSVANGQPPTPPETSWPDRYLLPDLDPEALSSLVPEAEESLNTIEFILLRLAGAPQDQDSIERFFQATHTLKGSALKVQFHIIGDITQLVEDFMSAVTDGRARIEPEPMDLLLQAVGLTRLLLRRDPRLLEELRQEVQALFPRLRRLTQPAESPPSQATLRVAPVSAPEPLAAEPPPAGLSPEPQPEAALPDGYLIPDLDPGVLSYFVPEAQEYLDTLESTLLELDKVPQDRDLIHKLFRTTHTLKSSAHTVSCAVIDDIAHPIEDLLDTVREGHREFTPALVEVMFRAVDVIRLLLKRDQDTLEHLRQKVGPLFRELGRLTQSPEPFIAQPTLLAEPVEPVPARELPAVAPQPETGAEASWQGSYLLPNLDPEVLSYFVPEAEEYLNAIETALLGLEKAPQDVELIHQLFRTAHTLKGSAYTVGYTIMGDMAHPIEDLAGAIKEGRQRFTPESADVILQAVDAMRLMLKRDPRTRDQIEEKVGTSLQELRRLVQPAEPDIQQPAPSAEPVEASSAARDTEPSPGSSLPDSYLRPDLDPDLLSYFVPEAEEYLNTIETALLRLEKAPQDQETIQLLFRTVHTLKGSAFTVDFRSIGDLAHLMEDFMVAVMEGRAQVAPGLMDLMLRAVDVTRTLLRRDPTKLEQTRRHFLQVRQEFLSLNQLHGLVLAPAAAPVEADQAKPANQPVDQGDVGSDDRRAATTTVIRVSQERLERLLNMVGEVVIARGRLDQRLQILQQLSQQVLSFQSRMLDFVRTFEDKHMFSIVQNDPSSDQPTSEGLQMLSDFGSLEFDKYDDLNILARRISEVSADVNESMSQLNTSIGQAREDMSQLHQHTIGMRDEISQARMLPIGTPFVRFRRAVREMARATGREVTLLTSGEQTEVDTGVAERIVDPLVHLVRNAVYHGIEPPEVRVSKGKPPVGTIYLHAAQRGSSVMIEVEDDGAGLDLERITAKAISRGLVRPEVARTLPESEVINFIFAPNVSTAEEVGDQAGRGVGMNVVKRAIESMGGRIAVETVRGIGTKFTMELPLTLLITTALLVRAGEERFAIPLPTVRELVMPKPGEIQSLGGRGILQVGDEAIRVDLLASVLHGTAELPAGSLPVVVARTPSGPRGFIVDELLGRQEIVIKSFGRLKLLQRSYFGGATIDPEGRVILVLDLSRLAESSTEETFRVAMEGESPRRPSPEEGKEAPVAQKKSDTASILLIDDSLSIRKFVGRMLESAGYQVDTAADGEEGLRKAFTGAFELIITDLEMPKVNGYEVIQALRARPQTQSAPVLVLTTRAGEKHRQMAMRLGATAYISKPVTEHALLQEVGRWLGHEMLARC